MHRSELTAYFLLVFIWIWSIAAFVFGFPEQAARIFGPMSSTNPLFILASWGPNVIAAALAGTRGGWRGLRMLLGKFALWRVPVAWYALVLIGIPVLGAAAAALAGTLTAAPIAARGPAALSHVGSLLWVLLITGAFGEELGWRGFALPRLLEKRSPLMSSLGLGLVWGLWHLPAFLGSGTPQSGTSLPAFILGAIGLSTMATWIFAHTRGSVLMASLLHFMANFCLNILNAPMLEFAVLLIVLCAVVVLVKPRWWLAEPAAATASARPT